jgi:hypothetical protein
MSGLTIVRRLRAILPLLTSFSAEKIVCAIVAVFMLSSGWAYRCMLPGECDYARILA